MDGIDHKRPVDEIKQSADQRRSQPPVRRVGTVTMGFALILAGVLLILNLLLPSIELWFWLRFSPVILIILGIEVLVSHFRFQNVKLKYDFFSAVMSFLVIFGGLGTALALEGLDYFRDHVLPQWTYQNDIAPIESLADGESIRFVHGSRLRGDQDVIYVVRVSSNGEESVIFSGVDNETAELKLREAQAAYESQLEENQLSYQQLNEDYEAQLETIRQFYEEQLEKRQAEYERQMEMLYGAYENKDGGSQTDAPILDDAEENSERAVVAEE